MTTLLTNPWLLQAAIFIGTTLAVVTMLHWVLKQIDPRVRNRLRQLDRLDGDETPPVAPIRRGLLSLLQPQTAAHLAANLVPNDERVRSKIQSRLLRAGIHHPNAVALFFTARLVAILVPPVAGVVMWACGMFRLDLAMLWATLLSGAGLIVPGLWLDSRIAHRQNILRQSLSDFLDLFVACVESGMTLQGMIGTVSEELRTTHPELSSEFSICQRQVQLGQSLEAATADLAERTGVDDLRSFNTFVQQSLRFGATIGTALRELSDMLREQREMRAEELAQKASVKILIPTLLFIFPAVFVVLVSPAAIRIQQSMSNVDSAQTEAAP